MEPERSDDRQSRKPLDWQEWLQRLESLRARCRERMIAQGYDPDTMTEDEKMEYVVNIIHEHREEERRRIAQVRPEPGQGDAETTIANPE